MVERALEQLKKDNSAKEEQRRNGDSKPKEGKEGTNSGATGSPEENGGVSKEGNSLPNPWTHRRRLPPVPPREGSTKQNLRLCPRKKRTMMMKKEAVVLLLPPAKNHPQRTLSNKRVVGQPQHPPSSSNSSLLQPLWNARTLQEAKTLRKEVMGLFRTKKAGRIKSCS
ncbi:hypothetical protein HPB51_029847 [Rhipicephalus microplus]|uniref:Uncharacterized protein n=1 Tax=Rhipicephalus microplus TaxID=6941 RepID=A0A9J6CTM5_RHIMP|nr:hypothetical protein HPB51_029847 [Rhipicephalus microplus]